MRNKILSNHKIQSKWLAFQKFYNQFFGSFNSQEEGVMGISAGGLPGFFLRLDSWT